MSKILGEGRSNRSRSQGGTEQMIIIFSDSETTMNVIGETVKKRLLKEVSLYRTNL